MKKFLGFLAVAIMLFIAVIFFLPMEREAEEGEPTTEGRVHVIATFYPLAHFAQMVGGEHIDVRQLVPPGAEPHAFEPSPQDIVAVNNADLFVFLGAGFDPWAEAIIRSVNNDRLEALEVTHDVPLMEAEEEEVHADEEIEDDHGDEGLDPHIWLDPVLAQEIVREIEAQLVAIDPAHATDYRRNAQVYLDELKALDDDFRSALATCRLDAIIVAHDAFGYLAKRYGFEVIPLAGLSPQDQPSAKRVGEIAELARERGIGHIFFETLTSPRLAETLANETGAQTLVLNPLEGLTTEQVEAGEDYARVMRANLANMKTALQCE